MKLKTEINIPDEILKEIEVYAKAENITVNEFILWALGEKVGELRERRGVKNLTRISINLNSSSEKTVVEKIQPMPNDTKRLLRAGDVAEYLNISNSEVYHLIQRGEILSVKFGRTVRIREEDLEEFVLRSKR